MLLFERIDPDLNTTLTLEYDRKPQYKLECLSYENLLKMATSTYLPVGLAYRGKETDRSMSIAQVSVSIGFSHFSLICKNFHFSLLKLLSF